MSMAAQNKITRSRAVRPSAMLSGVGDFGLAIELSDRFDSLGSGRRSMQPGADPRHHEQRERMAHETAPVPQEVRLLEIPRIKQGRWFVKSLPQPLANPGGFDILQI